MYKVTEKDLVGEIEGFPVEVVQKMLERQFDQEGYYDVSEFQGSNIGGFYWSKTPEGASFWNQVILRENFDLFFEKYPKEHGSEFWIDPKGRRMLVWSGDNEKDAKERVVMAKLPNSHFPYIVVNRDQENIFLEGGNCHIGAFEYAKPISAKEESVELTIDQIADKFGISVDKLKIKK